MTQAQNIAELSSDVNSSGILQVVGGGTGQASLTAENVILGNAASAVKFVAPGSSGNVLTSNGTTWASVAAAAFDSGTVMLFAQTSAPTGWTKNTTTGDNSALRVTTGAAGTGGSVAFTTAFASQTPAGTVANQTATNQSYTPTGSVTITSVAGSAGSTTLSTPQIPSHSHPVTAPLSNDFGNQSGYIYGNAGIGTHTNGSAGAGGNGGHTHPFAFSSGSGTFSGGAATILQNAHNHTFTGTAINLAVQYIDVIRATKT